MMGGRLTCFPCKVFNYQTIQLQLPFDVPSRQHRQMVVLTQVATLVLFLPEFLT